LTNKEGSRASRDTHVRADSDVILAFSPIEILYHKKHYIKSSVFKRSMHTFIPE